MRLPADDEGMASERTALAWARTGLSLFVMAAAIMAVGLRHGLVALAATAGPLVVVASAAVVWRAHRAYDRRRDEERCSADPVAPLVVAALTVFGAVVAAIAGVLAAV